MASISHCAVRRTAAKLTASIAVAAISSGGALRAADLQVEVRNLAGEPLAEVVVYAEPLVGVLPPRASSAPHVVIDQVHKQFVPRVSVVQTGTNVDFPNSDNIRHEVYSFSPTKVFTSKLYSGRQAAPVVFDKPGVVTLGCNIHDHMLAWVRVVDTPYFGKSATDGTSLLAGLKPGDYRLSVWYPGPESEPKVQEIHVGAANSTRIVVVLQPPSPLAAPLTSATS
jgi:plastocyanin